MLNARRQSYFYYWITTNQKKGREILVSKVDYNLLKYVNEVSKNGEMFVKNMKLIFTIKRLCGILQINRNRYNYLVRNDQLDETILTLYDESLYKG